MRNPVIGGHDPEAGRKVTEKTLLRLLLVTGSSNTRQENMGKELKIETLSR